MRWIRDLTNDFFQYMINLGFASSLSANIGNRLIKKNPDLPQEYVDEEPLSIHEALVKDLRDGIESSMDTGTHENYIPASEAVKLNHSPQ